MSLLRNLGERRAFDDYPRDSVHAELSERRRVSHAGPTVNPDTAMRLSTVWACINLNADVVSTLPFHAYMRGADGTRKLLPTQPEVLTNPSPTVSATAWRRQVMVSMLSQGNAFGLPQRRDNLRRAVQIETIDPGRLAAARKSPSAPIEWKLDGRPIDHEDLWHLPAFVWPGSPIGLSPIGYARQTIGLGLAAEEFGARWFGDGAHPSAVLTSDQPITKAQARAIKDRFLEAIRGRREPAVLGAGLTYAPISVPANESQFLETIRANVTTIARFFGTPPEMVGGEAGGSLTYANVEQRSLQFLTYGVGFWVVRLEEALTALLPPGVFVKANTDALLRTDLVTRYRAHDMALRGGWRSRNDIRRLEDEAPLEGEGDEYLWPPYRAFPIADDSKDPDAA